MKRLTNELNNRKKFERYLDCKRRDVFIWKQYDIRLLPDDELTKDQSYNYVKYRCLNKEFYGLLKDLLRFLVFASLRRRPLRCAYDDLRYRWNAYMGLIDFVKGTLGTYLGLMGPLNEGASLFRIKKYLNELRIADVNLLPDIKLVHDHMKKINKYSVSAAKSIHPAYKDLIEYYRVRLIISQLGNRKGLDVYLYKHILSYI